MMNRFKNTPLLPWLARVGALLALTGATEGQILEDLKLLAPDGTSGDEFGSSIATANGVVATGAPTAAGLAAAAGAVYLFDAHSGAQQAKLVASDGASSDRFGFSLSVSGNVLVVGAPGDDDLGAGSGSAYLFDAITGAQLVKLLPNDGSPGDEFGFDVAIDGGVVAVGAKRDDDNGQDSGSLYLFDASTGIQLRKLLPNDGATNDNFGEAVDLDGDLVVVGAHGDADNGPLSGSAYLFDVPTGLQLAKLLPLDGGTNDFFGSAVALKDGVVAVGAWADSVVFDHSGSAYLFDASSAQQQAKLVPSDAYDRDNFGFSLDLNGGVLVVGAKGNDDNGFQSGSAYLFDASDGAELTKILASDGAALDKFGHSVAIGAGIVAVGAPRDDDNGAESGSAYVLDTGDEVGTRLCFGDGSGLTCPCGNIGGEGRGCANSAGPGALLFATGSASIATDDLALLAQHSAPSTPGQFFQGAVPVSAGQGAIFGDGLRCAAGQVQRLQLVFASGQGEASSSTSVVAAGGPLPGQTRYYQWWYRDLGGPCGSGFNLSNAVRISWTP